VAGLSKQLRNEPVQAFQQLTYGKDSGVDFLRQVAQQAPEEMPKLGRAYLEGLFENATKDGGFDKARTIGNSWSQLGPETKKILFKNPMLVQDLDKFFLGAKKLAENPNPSGSGVVGWIAGQSALVVNHPATGVPLMIGAGALSKMLHSPAGVRALTNGLRVPLGSPAAASIAATNILKIAGNDAIPMTQGQDGVWTSESTTPTPAP
jgi:hypothetical protein